MKNAKELDQFYTNPKIAVDCITILKDTLDMIPGYKKSIQYIEPSAGTGAFYNLFPKRKVKGINGNKVSTAIGFDLEPKANGIIKCDFLEREINDNEMLPYSRRVVLGNPPFGSRSSMAIDFFNRAADWAPVIAFIIPIQFRKWSVQSKLHQEYDLVVDKDLPNDAFIFNGKPYHVNCCFQIWCKKRTFLKNLRLTERPTTIHSDFDMWQYNNTRAAEKVFNNEFDFAVLRQGYGDYTKQVTTSKGCSRKKQWILFKANSPRVLYRLQNLDFESLSKRNTTIPGFGKADVINMYSELYGE